MGSSPTPVARKGPVALVLAVLLLVAGAVVLVTRSEPELDRSQTAFLGALWPEKWRDELVEAQDQIDDGTVAWRLSPKETALNFATHALQWPDVAEARRCGPSVSPACDGGGVRYAIYRETGEPPLTVLLGQLGRTGPAGAWSVVEVQGARVTLELEPGDVVQTGAGPNISAETSLPPRVIEDLSTGSSYMLAGGCGGSGGVNPVTVDGNRLTFPPGAADTQCFSEGGAFGSSSGPGPLRSPASGFVYVALRYDHDSIDTALNGTLPDEVREDFLDPEPILDLAAVPVLFEPV